MFEILRPGKAGIEPAGLHQRGVGCRNSATAPLSST